LDSVVQVSVLPLEDIQALSLHTTHYSLAVLVESMAHTQDSHSEVSNKQDNKVDNKVSNNNNINKVVLVKPANNKPINKHIILPWDKKNEKNIHTNKNN